MNIAVIPARGGSKRIPRKNIKKFAGKPMLQYAIEAAQVADVFDEIVVSTDDNEIAEIAKALGLNGPEDLNSYESLKAAMEKNYDPEMVKNILDSFAQNKQVQDIGIPDDLKNEEIDRIKELAGLNLNSVVMSTNGIRMQK